MEDLEPRSFMTLDSGLHDEHRRTCNTRPMPKKLLNGKENHCIWDYDHLLRHKTNMTDDTCSSYFRSGTLSVHWNESRLDTELRKLSPAESRPRLVLLLDRERTRLL